MRIFRVKVTDAHTRVSDGRLFYCEPWRLVNVNLAEFHSFLDGDNVFESIFDQN